MTETDISKVLIEGDYATIMGVKYKRVVAPKSIRAEEIWKAFCEEIHSADPLGNTRTYDVKTENDVKTALSVAIRVVAERLYTDCGELSDPSVVLEEIADEIDAL
jgi:hypothetical protein